jgi:tripartite-type tricarboxylate transporter receptor subunit TctC
MQLEVAMRLADRGLRGFKALAVFGAIAACGVNQELRAQEFPNRPIRLVVPAAAGGGLDLVARVLAQKSSEVIGQQIYIENKPGANWIVGMEHVAKSMPDGYTLLLLSASGLSINPHVFKNVPALDQFTVITAPTKGAFVILLNPKIPVKSLPEFISLLKSSPGKYNHASNSASTILLSQLFKAQAGVEFVDVNYRGGSQSVADTVTGITDFCFVDLGSAMAYIQGGQLRPLGVSTETNYELVPELPPLSEAGVPGMAVDGGTVLVGPANLPAAVLLKLNHVFVQAIATPEVKKRFAATGQLPLGGSAEQTLATMQSESDRWKKLIIEKNIKIMSD